MPRRHRVRRVLKWTGTISCVLLAALWAVSTWRWIGVDKGTFQFYAQSGRIALPYIGHAAGRPARWFCDPIDDDVPAIWIPEFKSWQKDQEWFLSVPIWCMLAVLTPPTVVLWFTDRRRPRAGCCRECGYDLTGNVSGRCPECGAEILKGELASANEAGGDNAAGV